LGRHDEVAFIFAVFVIHQDDHAAISDVSNGVFNRVKFHGFSTKVLIYYRDASGRCQMRGTKFSRLGRQNITTTGMINTHTAAMKPPAGRTKLPASAQAAAAQPASTRDNPYWSKKKMLR